MLRNHNRITRYLGALALWMMHPAPSARALELDGSAKLSTVRSAEKHSSADLNVVQSSNRFQTRHPVSTQVSAEVAYELSILQFANEEGSEFSTAEPPAYRLADLNPLIREDNRFELRQNLDRLFFQYSPEAFDLLAGRQPIAFGSARAINPTDVFVPYSPFEIDVEHRLGIDALRLRYPLGDLAELDTGLVIGEDGEPDQSAAFLRTRFTASEQDIGLLYINFLRHQLLGFDLQLTIGDVGGWVEGALVMPETSKEADYTRVSAGFNHYLGDNNTLIFTEYHFSDAGGADRFTYNTVVSKTAFQAGAVFLLGRQYLIQGAQFEVTPLASLSASVFFNLGDASFLTDSALTYSLWEDFQASIGAYVGRGQDSDDSPAEFAQMPLVGHGTLRYYF